MLWHNWDLGRMKIHMWHRNPRIGTSASLVFWAFGHLMHISFGRWLPIYRGRHLVTCHPIIIVYLLITITVFRIYNTRMISHSNLTEISRPTPPFTFPQHRRWSFHSSWHPGIPACWWTAFLPRLGIGVSPLHLGLGHQVLETKRNQTQKRFRKCTNLIFSIKLSNKFQDNDVMDSLTWQVRGSSRHILSTLAEWRCWSVGGEIGFLSCRSRCPWDILRYLQMFATESHLAMDQKHENVCYPLIDIRIGAD